ncbi:MAG: carbonic anhydrase [Promethearchaeota archaeon]|jgi:carbonic anhydrase
MSDIERMLIEGNLRYHLKITQDLENIETKNKLPRYPILIITCIDPRIDIHRIFQLDPGDVFVIRNAGNLCTQDSLRSILFAIYQYNIKFIIVLGHLDCGMTKVSLLNLRGKVPHEFLPYRTKGTLDLFTETKEFFQLFTDELRNIKRQIETLHQLQVHNPEIKIQGMLYDVETGWVLEYDNVEEFASIENFREHYKTILREKQFQFIDFLDTIKDEIINPENLEKMTQEKESDKVEEKFINTVLNKNEKDLTDIQIQNLTTPIILTKLQVPKVYFPGVKIHIPKYIKREKDIRVKK